MNWSPNICKFSPLRTPHVKAAKEKHARLLGSPKLRAQAGMVSDVESVTSGTTRDIRALARAVQDKMGRMSTLDSDEDLFITQSFEKSKSKSKPNNDKTKRKLHDMSDSDLDSDSSSSEQPDASESFIDGTERVSTVDSDMDLFGSQTSVKTSSQPADVNKPKKPTVKATVKNNTDSELDSSSSESELSDSEPEKDIRSNTKSKRPSIVQTAAEVESRTPSRSQQVDDTAREMRFEIPEHFEMKPAKDIVPRASLEGKEIWLFSTPDDFDISALDGQTLNLDKDNLVNAVDESEKTWEVTCFPNFQDQLQTTSLCTVAATGRDMDTLSIGPEVSGQVLVMNWIPIMPPVQLKKQSREKHRVPDNLKPTFTPFGARAPVRYLKTAEDCQKKAKGKKRHKERQDSVTEAVASKKGKLSDSFGHEVDGDNAREKVSPWRVKKSKKHTEIEMGNNNVKGVTIKTEGRGDASEAILMGNEEQTENIQAKKKKKKKKKHASDEEAGISNIDDSADLSCEFNTSVGQSENSEKVKKKKKKHKKHEEVSADNDGSDLVSCADDGASVREKDKKKKHKKNEEVETVSADNATTDLVSCDDDSTRVREKDKKKKKHKKHDVVETDSADNIESKVKSKKNKRHKDNVDDSHEDTRGDETESAVKGKKKKKKHKD